MSPERPPRFRWLRGFKTPIRSAAFRLLRQTFETEDGRRILADALRGSLVGSPEVTGAEPPPYPDLGQPDNPATMSPPIFITGRFRSGSTLLWNIFRHVPSCTAFYEPLNERRWFDPVARGDRIDRTHIGVSDYWREYEGLAHLDKWYRKDWIQRDFYMPDNFWEPNLRAYIQALTEASPRRAVLQFNRVDFRLPWLRRNFPQAKLLHLFRHPRDQWCSSLVDAPSFPRDGSIKAFAPHDHFYLVTWAQDLSYHFPFLDPRNAEHPYDLFYMVWKLSYLFGRRYCHASFCFETLCDEAETELPRLMAAAAVQDYDLRLLKSLVVPQAHKWQVYADQQWFERRESYCESVLCRFADVNKGR